MKTLAKALIETAAFLALSGEDVISLDHSVGAIEQIADTLRSASPEEVAAIRAALMDLASEEQAGSARSDVLKFYEQFLQGFGLTKEGES